MLLDHRSNNRMNLERMYNTVFHCIYFSILDIELNYKGTQGSTDDRHRSEIRLIQIVNPW